MPTHGRWFRQTGWVLPWTDPAWIAIGIGATLLFGVLGLAAWRWPRSLKHRPARHETVWVEVKNEFPVFDLPDGTQRVGDHLVGVTLHNGSPTQVRVVAWGINLPGHRRLFVPKAATSWEPRLPHWVEPGDEATWHVEARELTVRQEELGCRFDEMIPYVSLGDGRELESKNAVPLK